MAGAATKAQNSLAMQTRHKWPAVALVFVFGASAKCLQCKQAVRQGRVPGARTARAAPSQGKPGLKRRTGPQGQTAPAGISSTSRARCASPMPAKSVLSRIFNEGACLADGMTGQAKVGTSPPEMPRKTVAHRATGDARHKKRASDFNILLNPIKILLKLI